KPLSAMPTLSLHDALPISYADFVEQYAGVEAQKSGDIVTESGDVVGTHAGIHKYTVGQRKGLIAAGTPQYVVRIEPELNQIVIRSEEHTSELQSPDHLVCR